MAHVSARHLGPADISTPFGQTARVAWRLVELSSARLGDVEERANAILAVIIGGMLAIWATIASFDPGATRAIVYVAWAIVVVSVFVHGVTVLPRRRHRLSRPLEPGCVFNRGRPLTLSEECEIACSLWAAIDGETRRAVRGIRWAVALNLLALALIGSAYLVELI
jgi:hypothetical protein